mmetsp:Transcript_18920/g.37170  ORF Transcript_18920/g.37170 Transcript_18920/m.37170 type:complete len:259 (-) Transcript_18920:553-1329(-)
MINLGLVHGCCGPDGCLMECRKELRVEVFLLVLCVQPRCNRESLACQETRVVQFRCITLSQITEHSHHSVSWSKVLSNSNSSCDIDRSGATDRESFFLQQFVQRIDHLRIRNFVEQVGSKALHVACDPSLSNALGDGATFRPELTLGEVSVKSSSAGIGETDLDTRYISPEILRGACKGSSCAHGTGEGIEPASHLNGLAGDLGACRFHMGTAVGKVIPLVGVECVHASGALDFSGKSLGDVHVVVGVLVRHWRNFDQ